MRGNQPLISANVLMISGCQDKQTSADVQSVSDFCLPDPAGRSGGACTSALLKVLYHKQKVPQKPLSWRDTMLEMRKILKKKKFDQVPQLSSSVKIDVDKRFQLVPDYVRGIKRAVMIGINYIGQEGCLSGCHNDVCNMKAYLIDVLGFKDENIVVLMDDGQHIPPTKSNILLSLLTLCKKSKVGDAAYFHYSGHGGRIKDENGDESDGYDETLVPVDFAQAGQIKDDELYHLLVGAMPRNTSLTCVMDCCHSGSVLDLPYIILGDKKAVAMSCNQKHSLARIERMIHLAEI